MKLAMPTTGFGIRSRSSALSSSGTVVVAVSNADAATPRVPFTTMFQAPDSPGSDSVRKPTSLYGPRATNGRNTANARKGSSMTSRLASRPSGTCAAIAMPTMINASSANAQIASRGVATTAKTNSTVATSLHSGASRCTPDSACTKKTWLCPGPVAISAGRGGGVTAEPADGQDQAGGENEAEGDADDRGQPGRHRRVGHLGHAVVGQRAGGEVMVDRLILETLVDGNPLQTV